MTAAQGQGLQGMTNNMQKNEVNQPSTGIG
jgi:hypothetical protein